MTLPVFVGIDVAKATLEVAVRPSGECWQLANEEAALLPLVTRLQALGPTLVVLEATGGFEHAAVAALAAAAAPVVVAHPRQVRDFARATGQLAKTDTIDAQTLALFAERVRPTPRPLPDEAVQALDAVLTRRRQLLEMLTAERNRLGLARPPVARRIRTHIRWLQRELADVDRDLGRLIEQSPVWRAQDDLLQSVPEWARSSVAPCSVSSRSSDASAANRSRRWSAWPLSPVTAAPFKADASSGAAAPRYARCSTWVPS
jgi:transposase